MRVRLGAVRKVRAVAIAIGIALPTLTAFWLPARGDAGASAEATFVSSTNQERAQRAESSLHVTGDLVAVARRHSEAMAAQARLYHNPNVGNEVARWQLLGENVGTGPGAGAVEQAFMASAEHRANILNPAFTEIGVSVVWVGNRLWVTVLFREPFAQAAAPLAAAPGPPRSSPPRGGTQRALASTPTSDTAAEPPPLINRDTLLLALDVKTESGLPLDPVSQARIPQVPVTPISPPSPRLHPVPRPQAPSLAVRHVTGVALSLLLAVMAAAAWVGTAEDPDRSDANRRAPQPVWRLRLA
jgi:hypothetical protein